MTKHAWYIGSFVVIYTLVHRIEVFVLLCILGFLFWELTD